MAGYIGPAPVPQATQTREVFTLSSTQTTVGTGGYTPGFVDVYLNGAKLAPADFTATNGSDIVLASAAAANDILEVVAFQEFTVVDQTFSGDITFTGANYNLVWDASDDALEFRDTALKISSSADGQLDLDADTEIEITAPTVQVNASSAFDVNGNIDVSGTGLVTGVLTTTAQVVQNGGFDSNDASTIVAADGAADNQFALQIQNLESTNDRSYGLYIRAGTTVTDSPLHIYDYTGSTQLFRVTGTGQTLFTDGSESLPSITNIGDTNTGIFFPAADTIAFSEGGSEAMRIDSSGNVGIGTNSPNTTLTLSDNTDEFDFGVTTNQLMIKSVTSDGSDDQRIIIDAGNGGQSSARGAFIALSGNEASSNPGQAIYQMGNVTGASHVFRKAGGNDAVTIDSDGEMGIGTSNPGFPLSVEVDNNTWVSRIYNTGSDANASGLLVRTDATSAHNALAFGVYADSSYKMVVKSTGNVGIGETTPLSRIQISTSTGESDIRLHRTDTAIANNDIYGNIFFSGDDSDSNANGIRGFVRGKAQGTGGGMKLEFGTAGGGAAIGSDPRMTLDADGNLGIGVSPSEKFHVDSGSTDTVALFESSGDANAYLIVKDSGSSGGAFFGANGTSTIIGTGGSTTRMTIDSSGNLLVNTASSNTSTTIVGSGGFAVKPQTGNGTRVDISNNGEAMLLDGPSSGPIVAFYNAGSAAGNIGTNNSGDLYIGNDDTTLLFAGGSDMIIPRGTDGATRDGAIDLGAADHRFKTIYGSEYINLGFTDTQNAQLYCSQSANLTGCRIDNSQNSSTSNNFWSVLFGTGNDNTTAVHYAAYTQTGNRFIVYGNGNVQNLNNSYGALSDKKLKENIVDSGSQWDDIKAIKVRKYSLKEAKLDAPNMLGVVAQELETAGMNGLVYESPDRNLDGDDLGTTTKNVNYSVLYMKAVKALQETMARVEALEVKVAALEAGS